MEFSLAFFFASSSTALESAPNCTFRSAPKCLAYPGSNGDIGLGSGDKYA